eukprot:7086394-Pyramimonas_sp.AAC.1
MPMARGMAHLIADQGRADDVGDIDAAEEVLQGQRRHRVHRHYAGADESVPRVDGPSSQACTCQPWPPFERSAGGRHAARGRLGRAGP